MKIHLFLLYQAIFHFYILHIFVPVSLNPVFNPMTFIIGVLFILV